MFPRWGKELDITYCQTYMSKQNLIEEMKILCDKIAEMEAGRLAMKFGASNKYVSLRELIKLKLQFKKLQDKHYKLSQKV